ncbi:hypothetical protein [Chondromyces crocatus]|nr:hypothetical protein [Chondromyces crocatus]
MVSAALSESVTLLDAAEPPPPESAEVISLRDLEMILSPGIEPPPLDPGNIEGRAAPPGEKIVSSSSAPPFPPPPPKPRQPFPSTSGEPRTTSSAPAAADGARPTRDTEGLVDRSIFRVDSVPPPRLAGGEEEISVDFDRGVESGLSDLRRLSGAPRSEPTRRRPMRADEDVLLNLSGGLFSSSSALVTPMPPQALAPPPVHPAGAPPAIPPPPPTAGPAPALGPTPLMFAPGTASTPPLAHRPQRRGLLLGALAALAVAGMVAAFMLASGGGDTQPGKEDGHLAMLGATTTGAPEAPPSSPLPGSPTAQELSPDAAAMASVAASAASAQALVGASSSSPTEPRRETAARDRAAVAQPAAKTTKAAATPTAAPEAAPAGAGDFNRSAAIAALNGAAASAAMSCKQGDAGGAKVSVTFAPSGRVTSARVESGPFVGTPTGGCIATVFRGARVPPFSGGPVAVSKQVNIR